MENEKKAQIEAHYQKEIESIKGEVARLTNLLEQTLSFKNGKGMFAQPLVEASSTYVPHTSQNLGVDLVTRQHFIHFPPSSQLKLKSSWIQQYKDLLIIDLLVP